MHEETSDEPLNIFVAGNHQRFYKVVKKLEERHRKNKSYPLLPGDILCHESDGNFFKESPGFGMAGFILSPADMHFLEPVDEYGRPFGGTS